MTNGTPPDKAAEKGTGKAPGAPAPPGPKPKAPKPAGEAPSAAGPRPTPPPKASTPPKPTPPPASTNEDKSMGELVVEISEQASILIREEVELAKAEISEKANRLLAGSVAGIVAGVFLIAALILFMHGIAIVLGENLFDGRVWLGYLIEAIVFIGIATGAGLFAYRSIKRGAPPTPDMAIEEAREIRAAFEGPEKQT